MTNWFERTLARDPARWRRRIVGRYRYVRLRWRLVMAAVDAVGYGLLLVGGLLGLRARQTGGMRAILGVRRASRADAQPAPPVRRVLLVQLDHLGDAVITLAMLPHLRRHFPDATIDVVASPAAAEVFKISGQVDRILIVQTTRLARREVWGRLPARAQGYHGWPGTAAERWSQQCRRAMSLATRLLHRACAPAALAFVAPLRPLRWMTALTTCAWRLRRDRYDVGIDVRGELPHAWLLWLAGCRRRVGFSAGGGGFLLTDSARFVVGRPEVESRRALLTCLGDDTVAAVAAPRVAPSPAALAAVDARLAAFGVDLAPRGDRPGARRLVVVHLGAGTPAKRWPPAHFRHLVRRLHAACGAHMVLVGAHDATAAARLIAPAPDSPSHVDACRAPQALDRAPHVLDWTNQLTLDEFAALVSHADLFIGADSGPAHLAAAVGTPVLVLFSGTNDRRQWQPRGEVVRVLAHEVPCSPCHRQRCPLAAHPCMHDLSPETVAAAAIAMLASSSTDESMLDATPHPPHVAETMLTGESS